MYVDQMKELTQLLMKKLHTFLKKELHTSIGCYKICKKSTVKFLKCFDESLYQSDRFTVFGEPLNGKGKEQNCFVSQWLQCEINKL